MESLRRDLETARSYAGSDTTSALNLLRLTQKDWGDLRGEAARGRIYVLLRASQPREDEALREVKALASEPGASAQGSSYALAAAELLGYLKGDAGRSIAAWERRRSFIRSLGRPAPELAALGAAYDETRAAILSGYLRCFGNAATESLQAEKPTEARKVLDRAYQLVAEEKLEVSLPTEVAGLDRKKKDLERLEAEIADWEALRPIIPSAGMEMAKLPGGEVLDRVRRFAAFVEKHPDARRRDSAESYRRRYQEELDERRAKAKK
jgi:hypothetical protein